MRPTHVWDPDPAKAQKFAAQYDCEVVDRYDGMLGKVDAVMNGELNSVPWQHLLLRPYLEAGVPCFLQRPWSDTLTHMDAMLDLSAKHNTPLMATVPFEHNRQAEEAVARLKTIGQIEAVFGTARIGDAPHFHLPYLLMKIVGYDVDQVSLIANDYRKVTYFNLNYVYPATDKRHPFVVSMQSARPDDWEFTIKGDQGSFSYNIGSAADYFTRFFPTLLDAQIAFERRELYQPLDVVRRKFQCVQAAYYSMLERNGAPVKIGTVPADWAIPAWTPNYYDGVDFKS
jgi:predicted dehydrogenase